MWVGEQVYVKYWVGDKSNAAECLLQSVGDRGITVRHKEDTRYFPWHTVLEISPISERRPRPKGVIR